MCVCGGCGGGDKTEHQQELEPVMLFKVSSYKTGLVNMRLWVPSLPNTTGGGKDEGEEKGGGGGGGLRPLF